jgi:hypothetical protein
MKTLRLCKFDLLNEQEPEPVTIIIDDSIPNHTYLSESERFHDRQAAELEKALYNSLPQGTYDRLAILFASRKVSLYRGKTE